MPTTLYTLDADWSASARFTAATDMDINIGNPSTWARLSWDLTTDDTPPAVAPALATPMLPGAEKGLQLRAGERLWLAGAKGEPAVLVQS
ncbi:hypothetical protein RGUI_4120 [Rhodovulum sp. P5]|uniref:hypothetical protein n=1 Tax=Rhodovulum phage vB_RhkS_P1 TaxID=1873452 RepID=UPI00080ABB93|nr:hypothetical protein [Rhodovulum sp. P5]YP_009285939.1 hypothetical protein BI026_gp54 [Rhodovulum phage vB_RhkS_P1]ANT39925.1 hypothetical protein Rhks_54 [Rhodovulum phage vB_RhkS_P1]ARE38993.1 hypothetical protein RGUI_0852 [Rhodovulum sp. P5]ARE42261.1 hypothetical protein RGUI_4120 [Rhodovulum sp. P5]